MQNIKKSFRKYYIDREQHVLIYYYQIGIKLGIECFSYEIILKASKIFKGGIIMTYVAPMMEEVEIEATMRDCSCACGSVTGSGGGSC